MKIKLLLFAVLGIWVPNLWAQDQLITLKNDTIPVKIIKTDSNDLYYQWKKNNRTLNYKVKKSDLRYAIYADGKIDTFNANIFVVENQIIGTAGDSSFTAEYAKGYADGYEYFETSNYTASGIASTICCTPIGGLVTCLVESQIKVSERKLSKNAVYATSTNKDYKKGFKDAANKKKNRFVYQSVGVTTGVLVGLTIMTVVLQSMFFF